MKRIRYLLRQGFTAVAVVMLVGITPASVFAEDLSTTSTDPLTYTAPPDNGPTGSSAHTFHYNYESGQWENDHYTFNPDTHTTVPKVPLEFTCNPDTHRWDATMWEYVASYDRYEQAPISLLVPPAGAITHECPVVETAPTLTESALTDGTSEQSIDSVNPNLPTEENSAGNTQSTTTNATLNTNVRSDSTSGSALVVGNDDVGTITSGDASAMANIINMLQSQASFSGGGLNTFTANIQGNVQGDFLIDPAKLAQPATVNPNDLTNTKITSVNNGTINNNIVLNAVSGDATAEDNDDVLGVGTGDARAIADVVNMINSVVAANQSFLGVINIYGDYTGNILMPADSLNALLGTNSQITNQSDTDVTTNDNFAINNNINLGATSGTATARNNDDVGSVGTGEAMTNLTILNLTGKQVVAANSLLVFVNVLGNWVGLIMDAPAGTTSAALGGGVNTNATVAGQSDISSTNNYAINNNITANAATGNATATNNDDVGYVTTGNAMAGVNVANLINSNFSLSNWFGVLFINVFGNWHGNFAVAKPPVTIPAITSGASGPASGGGVGIEAVKVFAFVPGGVSSSNGLHLTPLNINANNSSTNGSNPGGGTTVIHKTAAVLNTLRDKATKPQIAAQQAARETFNVWSVLLLGIGSAGLGFVAVERYRRNIRSQYLQK